MAVDPELHRRAMLFADRRRMVLTDVLGSGNNGTVWTTTAASALKVCYDQGPFDREHLAYLRFRGTNEIAGFSVPRLISADRSLLALELSIVRPPFVLDFASAYPVDEAPEFPDDVMAEWLADKQEQFGADWPRAAQVIRAIERDFGLKLTDVHPANIRFSNV